MTIPDQVFPHSVDIKDLLGNGSQGPVFGPPRTIDRVLVEDKRRLVRDADGKEVVSSARVFIEDGYGDIPMESRVVLWQGTTRRRESGVIGTAYHTHPEIASFTEYQLA